MLADPNQEILGLEATTLRYFYDGSIITVSSNQEIINTLKSRGKPELLLVDLDLVTHENGALQVFLEEMKVFFPVIASSNSSEAHTIIKNFTTVSGLLEKPVSVDAFTDLVKGLITGPASSPSHVAIGIKTILDMECTNFDLYLKLSSSNYVKFISKNDVFSTLDAEKLMAKGVEDLHVLASDAYDLLRGWEKKLQSSGPVENSKVEPKQVVIAIEALESIERISKSMNWSQEIVTSAQKAVNTAIVMLSKDTQLAGILRLKLANRSSDFSRHVGLMCFLNCAFSSYLGWTHEAGQVKLVMAALLHDVALDESYYKNIYTWNARASNFKDKSPETVKYRLHPLHASKLACKLELLPPDVDQIILQHHERKDGSGFPRSLTYSQISHLTTVFIMVEDLVDFIGDGQHLETSVKDYLTWGQSFYDQGNFKKFFDKIKIKIEVP